MIYRDDDAIAFLSLHQVNPGHVLVCPTRHIASFTELRPSETSQLLSVAQRIARIQREKLERCAGTTLSLADGVDAGQDVPHCHLHVIPRIRGDGFGWKHVGRRLARAELDAIALELRGSV